MQLKTKLFSVLFAFALFFPCLFILTACGGNPGLKDNEITINVSNKVYDGQAIAVTATATSGETPTVVYKLAGADDSTYTTTAPKDAGNYVVSAGVAESSEYKAAVGTRNFSITAKEITLAWTAPANLAYDKTAKVATVQPSGIIQGDECNVQAAVTQGQNNVNAGSFTFTATLSGAAAANYALQDNGVSPQYTITPLDVTINWTAPANLVYNKQTKEPDVEITAGLLAGDLCDVQKTLVAGHDNVNVGGFQFAATGLTNPNYKLPQNAVSPLQANIFWQNFDNKKSP